jgi:N-acetyltransferase
MPFEFQPTDLNNPTIQLIPLCESDFDLLFAVASDPKIWEQHPNPNRYKKEDFNIYFKGAIESKGAFLVVDSKTKEVIGCSRFYDYDEQKSVVLIGYTFIAVKFWGKKINSQMKSLMMNHAFRFVNKIHFHVGAFNKRSQIAMERLGGTKIEEQEVEYFGETSKLNFVYEICN